MLRKKLLNKICYELKVFLSEKDYEELMEKGRVVLFDKEKDVSKFIERPEIAKISLRVCPPLIFVDVSLLIGTKCIVIPVLCVNTILIGEDL